MCISIFSFHLLKKKHLLSKKPRRCVDMQYLGDLNVNNVNIFQYNKTLMCFILLKYINMINTQMCDFKRLECDFKAKFKK